MTQPLWSLPAEIKNAPFVVPTRTVTRVKDVKFVLSNLELRKRNIPESGHRSAHAECPLCATSRHWCRYSITSSARASSVGGMVRPSALAVLRLITSSYLVGACTGKSAGFSPSEDTIDVSRRTPVLIEEIRTIGDQATGGDEVAFIIDRRKFVPRRHRNNWVAIDRVVICLLNAREVFTITNH